MYRLGAKMPPALPDEYDAIVPTIFKAHSSTIVLQHQAAVQRQIDRLVSDPHDRRAQDDQPADQHAAHRRLEHQRRRRQALEQRSGTRAALAKRPARGTRRRCPAPRRPAAPPGARDGRSGHGTTARCRESSARRSRNATDATTVDPSSVAFKSPMISSSVNSTAATGVLNAAASAPVAPTETSARTRAGGSRSHRPMAEAMPAPIWTDGPSRPIEWPEAMRQDAEAETCRSGRVPE